MKIRIVNLDFYMNTPISSLDVIYSDFRGSSVNHVPVIRIFGSTEAGHKICLHVHGVFPYIYIPYDGQTPAEGFLYQIAAGLDKAINLSLGQTSSNLQHIYKVSLVSGIPLYGYHARKHQFLKLYFYNPLIIKKACMLLQNGSILGKIYQPNEAHIPYILQFMIDYNLHGMSFIYLKDLKYRVDPNCPNEYPENTILPITISKMSVCKVEADTQADCILNREEITPGKLTVNPGIKAIWDDEKQRRRNIDESSQIDHCLTQNRVDVPPTATHVAYKNVLEEKLENNLRNDRSPSLDLSVYPAETPSTADVLNASTIENHTVDSQSIDNSDLDDTITPGHNMTNFDENILDEDAQKLYDLLQDLRQDNVEKDSILSQVQKDAESEEEGDLSLPLDALQTPRKIDEPTAQTDDFWNDSYFDTLVHIPQVDGSCEEKTKRKRKKKKKFKLIDNSELEIIEGKGDNNVQLFEKGCIEKSNRKMWKHKSKERRKKHTFKVNTKSLFNQFKQRGRDSLTKYNTNDISVYFIKSNDTDKKSFYSSTSVLSLNSLGSYSKKSNSIDVLNIKRKSIPSKNLKESPRRHKSPNKSCVKDVSVFFEKHFKPPNTNKKLSSCVNNGPSDFSFGSNSFDLQEVAISDLNNDVHNDKRSFISTTLDQTGANNRILFGRNENEIEKSSKTNNLYFSKNKTYEEQGLKCSISLRYLQETYKRSFTKNETERNQRAFSDNQDNGILSQSKKSLDSPNKELQSESFKKLDHLHEKNEELLDTNIQQFSENYSLYSNYSVSPNKKRSLISYKKPKQAKNQEPPCVEQEFSKKSNSFSNNSNTRDTREVSKLLKDLERKEKTPNSGAFNDITKFSVMSISSWSNNATLNIKQKCKSLHNLEQLQTDRNTCGTDEGGAVSDSSKKSNLDLNNSVLKSFKKVKRKHNEQYHRINKSDTMMKVPGKITGNLLPVSQTIETKNLLITGNIEVFENLQNNTHPPIELSKISKENAIGKTNVLPHMPTLDYTSDENSLKKEEIKEMNSVQTFVSGGAISIKDCNNNLNDYTAEMYKDSDSCFNNDELQLEQNRASFKNNVNKTKLTKKSVNKKLSKKSKMKLNIENVEIEKVIADICKNILVNEKSMQIMKVPGKITENLLPVTQTIETKNLLITGNTEVFENPQNNAHPPIEFNKISKENAIGETNVLPHMPTLDYTSVESSLKKKDIKEMNSVQKFVSGGDISIKDCNNNSNDYSAETQCTFKINKEFDLHCKKEYSKELVHQVGEENFKEENQISEFTNHGLNDSEKCNNMVGNVESLNLICTKRLSMSYMSYNSRYNLRPRKTSRKLVSTNISQNYIVKTKSTRKKTFKSKGTQTIVKKKRDTLKTIKSNVKCDKPILNFKIKATGIKDEYEVSVCNNFKNQDLGPNPKPKFRIVPAQRPYMFELKKKINYEYPNTTWTCDQEISNKYNKIFNEKKQNEGNNSVVIISDTLLKNHEKYDEACIEKGRPVDILSYRKSDQESQNINADIPEVLSVIGNTNSNTSLKRLTSIEMETVESLSMLLNEIQENLYDNYENQNDLMETTHATQNLNACGASDFATDSNIILSFDDLDSSDLTEYTDYDANDPERATSKDKIVQEHQKESNLDVNDYRYKIKNDFKHVCEKLEKSFDNLFEDVRLVNGLGSTSNKLILDNIKEKSRKQQGGILVRNRIQRCEKKIRFQQTCKVRSYSSFDSPCLYSDNFVALNANENQKSYKKVRSDVKFQKRYRKNKKDNAKILKSTTNNSAVFQCNKENDRSSSEIDMFKCDDSEVLENNIEEEYTAENKSKQFIKLKKKITFDIVQKDSATETYSDVDETDKICRNQDIKTNSDQVLIKISQNASDTSISKPNKIISQNFNCNKLKEPIRLKKSEHKIKTERKPSTIVRETITPEQFAGAEMESSATTQEACRRVQKTLSAVIIGNKNCPGSIVSNRQNTVANTEDVLDITETHTFKPDKMKIFENEIVNTDANKSQKPTKLKKSNYKLKLKKKPSTNVRETLNTLPCQLAENSVANNYFSKTIQICGANKLITTGSSDTGLHTTTGSALEVMQRDLPPVILAKSNCPKIVVLNRQSVIANSEDVLDIAETHTFKSDKMKSFENEIVNENTDTNKPQKPTKLKKLEYKRNPEKKSSTNVCERLSTTLPGHFSKNTIANKNFAKTIQAIGTNKCSTGSSDTGLHTTTGSAFEVVERDLPAVNKLIYSGSSDAGKFQSHIQMKESSTHQIKLFKSQMIDKVRNKQKRRSQKNTILNENVSCFTSVLQNMNQAINCYKDIDERVFASNILRQPCISCLKDLALCEKGLPKVLKLLHHCFVNLPGYHFLKSDIGHMYNKCELQESSKRLRNIFPSLPNSSCISQPDSSNSVAASKRIINNQQGIDDGKSNIKSDGLLKRKRSSEEYKNLSNSAVNQYRYLDGPNDSSSENEDSVRPLKKKKRRQFRKASSQSAKYSPLKVQYGSPTKNIQASENNSNLQNPLYRPSISLAKEDLNNSSTKTDDQHIQNHQQKHRRKLNFSEMSVQNRTEIEENLVCRYKSDKKLSDKIQTISTPPCKELQISQNDQALISSGTSNFSSENMDEINKFPNVSVFSTSHEDVDILNDSVNDSSNIVNINQIVNNQENVEATNSDILKVSEKCYKHLSINQIVPYQEVQNKTKSNDLTHITVSQTSAGSESISDDMFSPDYLHASFSSVFSLSGSTNKEADDLNEDPAELYDAKNKFVPQAGTSKLNKTLTQSSAESNDRKTPIQSQSSLESKQTEVSSSAENQFETKSITSNISGDKSNMNVITPYQKEISNLNHIEINSAKNSCSNENCNESSTSEITPYQKEHSRVRSDKESKLNLTSYLTVCESFVQSAPIKGGPCIVVPKYNPPSRSMIESTLSEYNIPDVHHQQPFYSDVNHVTGAMEIGVRILKIPSNNIVDMPEFENNYTGLNHYRKLVLEKMYPNEKISNKDINNYKLSFSRDTECLITTAKLPPSRGEIELWLKDRLVKKHKTTKVLERKKVFIPCSPSGDNDESDDSLTISPCTPLENTLTNIEADDGGNKTFKSSFEDENTNVSPIIKKSEILRRHRKRLIEKPKSNLSKETNNLSNDSDKSINTAQDVSKLNVSKHNQNDSYEITGVTLDRTNNFAMSSHNLQNAKAVCEYLHLTVMCMELIVETRSDHNPNPSHDTIKGIVYKIFNDVPENHTSKRAITGCILIKNILTSSSKVKFSVLDGISVNDNNVKVTDTEEDLLYQFTALVTECDPDILVGYEIEMLSWGYLIERGYILNLNLVSLLSRIPLSSKKKNEDNSDLAIPGRIVLDFWRLLRHEVALQSYTFENIVYHVLHQRVPYYSLKNITYWWNHPSALYRGKVLKYYFFRVESVLKIMDQLDLIGRTSELAKLFGIQFFEVLSRGSQFRVESMMLRLAKPLNYIPVSPSVQQRANMRAPESLPLIMEPESKFYPDPVIVLDFQSLYPSIIIAYNYCFSTCLGRIEHLGGDSPFDFGATQLKVSRKRVKSLLRRDLINISPVGVAYVKKSVREGILPRMLQEILDTRLMVKKSLKQNAGNKTLEKILDARQLGLKLIANVTYGYTAANFSGRMPCIEVADSVVSKGRETLQRAINLVEKTSKWRAKVVYGDTDSLFVLVAGRSREDAFRIGSEIAEAVTHDNPSPVKLKLEKVFLPCILQTKKRYVGYMYESPEQDEPEYCAKGIETVRRDGCPAVSKMLEKCLKILFDTRNVSLVRQYVIRQFSKILSCRISIQDLTFAKEYRGSSSYRPGACVPALELARKWMRTDKRSEPRRGERVPYVIINGPPGLPLIRLVRSPREVIADPSLRLNSLYYITKVIIPPINRCFLLIGADVNNWFNDMPRKHFQYLPTSSPVKGKKSTISQYFSTKNCAVCGEQSQEGLCQTCLERPQNTGIILHEKVRILEKNYYETNMVLNVLGDSDLVSFSSVI